MELNYESLLAAVSGNDAAIRLTVRLQPAGGPGTKVFPPTHSGGVYAWEMRRISKDEVVPTVLLDSVQSQANRMEQALLAEYRINEQFTLPILEVDFSNDFPDIGTITTLDAPHRIADAIFRDSLYNGVRFRDSDIGQAFASANTRNATALFQYCPHALVFGIWDSTGSSGGLGNKIQRAVVSEIIGVSVSKGVLTSSRLDPLGIKDLKIYRSNNGDWTPDPDKASKDNDGNPIPYKKKSKDKGKSSELNHSNIPPTIETEERSNDPIRGGITLDYAFQTTVLSLPALRRLRFPTNNEETTKRNNAARAVLAALSLAAITLQQDQGYDLRSRCLLIPEGDAEFELVASNGKAEPFKLNSELAINIFRQAISGATDAGLSWQSDPVSLMPENRLVELVRRSRTAQEEA